MKQVFIALLLCTLTWWLPSNPATIESVQLGGDIVVLIDGEEFWCEECNPLLFGEKININIASGPILQKLPYIGKKRADKIVEWRDANGDFSSVTDLQKIHGIGPKSVIKILPYAKVQ